MSQSFIFRYGCWIYTKKSERENMKGCIDVLKRDTTCCMSGFHYFMPKKSPHSIRLAVYYLLGAGVINCKQRGEIRIFRLAPTWEKKLKAALKVFVKPKGYKNVRLVKKPAELQDNAQPDSEVEGVYI